MYAPAMGRARKFVPPGQQWTPRHVEVLNLLARGRTNPEIAETLGITLDGAKYHIREILSALGVDSREDAADYWRAETSAPSRLKRNLKNLALLPAVRWGLLAGTGAALAAGGLAFLFLARDHAAGEPPEVGLVFQIEPVRGEPFLLTVAASDGHEIARAPQDAFAQATAGRYVLLQSQSGVEAMAIDGSQRHSLYSPTPGKVVSGLSPSPVGSRLAVLERVETGGYDSVILLDVDTASELARFNRDDPRFQGFLGGFQQVIWHRHDGGLTIGSGGVQVEGDHAFRQSLAYVDPDGKVTITVVDASAAVAPDGERVLAGSPRDARLHGVRFNSRIAPR